MTTSPLTLTVWLSPSFPVGAFAYSHGLEWAFEVGDLHDAASLRGWLEDLIRHGALRNDLILLGGVWRLLSDGTRARDSEAKAAVPRPAIEQSLSDLCELALALANSAERRLETVTQGNAFVASIRAAWPCAAIENLRACWPGDVAYPVALGAAAAGHGLPLLQTLDAYGLAFAANLVSAAVRLGIVGQTDGQRITAALLPILHETAVSAEIAGLDGLGACAFRSDLAALRHETQYSRLFRS